MTFNAREISTDDGQPISLYLIEWGPTIYAYTSSDRPITYAGVTYLPEAISDTGLTQGGSSQNDFTLDVPTSLPIVDLFRSTPPSEPIWLTARRLHVGDGEAPIFWIGTISNVKRGDLANSQVIGRPLMASFKRTGLRLAWTVGCPHFIYDKSCRVDPEAFVVNAVVATVTGTAITLTLPTGKPDDWFKGGFLSWPVTVEGTLERRMIETHTGITLGIYGTTDRLTVGTNVKLYPGCSRTSETCETKFNNLANLGGFDFMPNKSPFKSQIF